VAYLLDTDIWSYFLKDQRGVRERVIACELTDLAISRVSAAELAAWAVRTESTRRRDMVSSLCRSARFFEVDLAVWQMFPDDRAELASRGRTIGMSDVLIGCCAALSGAVVVSNNQKHFTHICEVLGLELENWAEQG